MLRMGDILYLQEVPALDHEIFDDAMEQRVFVPHRDALFSVRSRVDGRLELVWYRTWQMSHKHHAFCAIVSRR
jgi:hypothetical protein